MGTALGRSQSETDLALKATAFEIPAWPVDGMDVLAVEDHARHAADMIRGGGGPVFLELRTYRFRAHSMYDPERYRERAEVEEWKTRDPLVTFPAALPPGFIDQATLARIEGEVALTDPGGGSLRGGGHSRARRGSRAVRLHGRGPVMTSDPGGSASQLQYRIAIRESIREAMIADDRVFLMGEDVGRYGGCFGVSTGLLEEFGTRTHT